MIIHYFVFFFLGLGFSSSAQDNNLFPDALMMKKNKVKSYTIRILYYEEDGTRINKLYTKYILEFDTSGLLTKSINHISPDSNRLNECYYYYNDKGQCIADTISNWWNGTTENYGTNYIYDEKGRMVKILAPEPYEGIKLYDDSHSFLAAPALKKQTSVMSYEYFEDKIVITKKCCFNPDENQKTILKLNTNGQVVEQALSFYNRKYVSKKFSYDKEGKLIKWREKIKGEKEIETAEYNYLSNGLISSIKITTETPYTGAGSRIVSYTYTNY